MSYSHVFEAERLVMAPPELVWAVFVNQLEATAQKMTESQFRPMGLEVKVTGEMLPPEIGKSLGWRGKWLGVAFERRFSFEPRDEGTLVRSSETLSGWPLIIARPFFSPRELAKATGDWLEAVAAMAENLYAAGRARPH